MILTDKAKELLRKEAAPIMLDIFEDERGITIYGRYLDKAVKRIISKEDCIEMKDEALVSTIVYIIFSIRLDLLHATSTHTIITSS